MYSIVMCYIYIYIQLLCVIYIYIYIQLLRDWTESYLLNGPICFHKSLCLHES